MASVSAGFTVTWNGTALGEITSVSVDGLQADSVEVTSRSQAARTKKFSVSDVDFGTVSVTCRGTSAMSTINVGLTGELAIAGPSLSLNFTRAILQSLGWNASVGELQAYNVTFKLGA